MKNKNVWQSLVIIFNAKSTFFSLSLKIFFNGSSSPKAKKMVCIKKTRLISAFEIEVDNNHCKLFSKLHHFLNFSRESCQCAMQTSQLALKYEIHCYHCCLRWFHLPSDATAATKLRKRLSLKKLTTHLLRKTHF